MLLISSPPHILGAQLHNQQERHSFFALKSQSESKLNEPTLFKQTLSLKFRLTAELLHWIGSTLQQRQQPAETGSVARARNQGNQSLLGDSSVSYQQLRLQCKSKLTDISDLTFNEMWVRQKLPQTSSQAHHSRSEEAAATTTTTSRSSTRRRLTDATPTSGSLVSLGRLPDQRLGQSKCPAKRAELQAGLRGGGSGGGDCRLGQLALQPDDPLIVEAEAVDQWSAAAERTSEAASTLSEVASPDDEDEEESEPSRRRRRRRRQVIGGVELSIGDAISVNCSTISSVLAGDEASICSDSEARRRSAISGKYQLAHESHPDALAANQRPQQQQQQHWMRSSGWIGNRGGQQQQQQQSSGGKLVSQLMLTEEQLESLAASSQPANDSAAAATTGGASHEAESTLSSGGGGGGTTAADKTKANGEQRLEAPPLLEWFINNQEVSCSFQRRHCRASFVSPVVSVGD